ncbi:MAG TPA: hypothetical protein VGL00_17245 [Terracidiphilus sp.]
MGFRSPLSRWPWPPGEQAHPVAIGKSESGRNEDGRTTINAVFSEVSGFRVGRWASRAGLILTVGVFASFCAGSRAAPYAGPELAAATEPAAATELADAPEPQTPAASQIPEKQPCPRKIVNGVVSGSDPSVAPGQTGQSPTPCKLTWRSRYELFANGPQDRPLKPRDKAWLAARNVADPFNNITILGEAAYSVGIDPHSPYGPGMAGYGRYVGVSYTQDMAGEFFCTFLIPSIVDQDPHYHRMPNAKVPRRIFHATTQVFWTQGDSGKGMPNYANIVGFAITDAISNLYVPGRETSLEATGSRYVIGLATAPIGNYITEFVPDVARHIHVQIVILQRIINQVARSEGGQP